MAYIVGNVVVTCALPAYQQRGLVLRQRHSDFQYDVSVAAGDVRDDELAFANGFWI
jgi:hypothetical protein